MVLQKIHEDNLLRHIRDCITKNGVIDKSYLSMQEEGVK